MHIKSYLEFEKIANMNNLVIVEEEFGRVYWLWQPEFDIKELQGWWSALPSFGFARTTEFLRGLLWSVEDDESMDYSEAKAIWDKHGQATDTFIMLCCDEDSYLYLHDKKLYHTGSTRAPENR